MPRTLPTYSLLIVFIWTFATLVGCESNSNSSAESAKTSAAATSAVPLRLWIVGQVSDPSLVERAWLTGSDQKLEIRILTVEQYLGEKTCNCDVTIFPARLLGEMIDRKWLTKLPALLNATDDNVQPVPSVWARQASYGGEVWAVSLGSTIPVTVVSESAAAFLTKENDWDSLLNLLAIEPAKSSVQKFDLAGVDRTTLVDRFLAIVVNLTQRSPDYGLLFDLQKMKPRLTEPEFVRAAEILLKLSTQPSSPETAIQSVASDSSQAWTWVNTQAKPALTIVSPTLLSASATQVTGCRAIRVPGQGIGSNQGSGWNTGSGLIASLSASCRQSSRATQLLQWLRQSETRKALSPLILGIESVSPTAGSDSSAWQAKSIATEQAANGKVPNELRLPRAEEYRSVLADKLITILTGEKPVAEALAEASVAWQSITDARGRELQRNDYEQSLGLTLK